jgi:hypothetical protein
MINLHAALIPLSDKKRFFIDAPFRGGQPAEINPAGQPVPIEPHGVTSRCLPPVDQRFHFSTNSRRNPQSFCGIFSSFWSEAACESGSHKRNLTVQLF